MTADPIDEAIARAVAAAPPPTDSQLHVVGLVLATVPDTDDEAQ